MGGVCQVVGPFRHPEGTRQALPTTRTPFSQVKYSCPATLPANTAPPPAGSTPPGRGARPRPRVGWRGRSCGRGGPRVLESFYAWSSSSFGLFPWPSGAVPLENQGCGAAAGRWIGGGVGAARGPRGAPVPGVPLAFEPTMESRSRRHRSNAHGLPLSAAPRFGPSRGPSPGRRGSRGGSRGRRGPGRRAGRRR